MPAPARFARALLLALTVAGAGCRPGGATLQTAWTGGDTGTASLPVRAHRCAGGPVELFAVSGDTGIIMALYGDQPLKPGAYRVADPAIAATVPPSATLGARWLDSMMIAGYRGADGTVTLSEAGSEIAGTFSARARPLDQSREVLITGTFRGVRIQPCRSPAAADSTPGGV